MLFPEGSIFLAPMEGVTDDIYRYTVEKCFGAWDYYACDFLRLPGNGRYKSKHIIKHYGKRSYDTPYLREKTYYQILASDSSDIENSVALVEELGFSWLDLNLGCPSKTVCKSRGGSYLLSNLKLMESVVTRIRKNFTNRFTVKIRVGFDDDKDFLNILSCLQGCGVEAITIHGRTREQLYKGVAEWDYIKQAVNHIDIPIIGNGDVWTTEDISRMLDYTQCHGVMVARGALKSPWLARDYRNKSQQDLVENIQLFLSTYHQQFILHQVPAERILKTFKGLSRYMFDDLPNGENLKTNLRRSQSLNDFLSIWKTYSGN